MEAIVLKDRITNGMTDEEFFWFCQENQILRIERNADLQVIIMSPVFTKGGFISGEVFRQLATWNVERKAGMLFDSSAGFTLPDRSVLSPDASWLSFNKWNKLTENDKDRFAPICPEFIIEVRSKSDNIHDLRTKMNTWIKNGAMVAWLIDPIDLCSTVYRHGQTPEEFQGLHKKLAGEGPVAGFELDLSLLKI